MKKPNDKLWLKVFGVEANAEGKFAISAVLIIVIAYLVTRIYLG